MNIEKKIKEAFSRDKRIRNAIKWNPDSQPNLYELSLFLQKSGYRLVDVLDHDTSKELIIEAIKANYLHPEIHHDPKENKFYANIIKYDMLEASDVEGIIKGYENALGVLKYLDSLDLSKLEIGEKEE